MWKEVIASTFLSHNIRKAWQTIKNLSNAPTTSTPLCLVHSNQFVHQLLINGRSTMPCTPKPTEATGEVTLVYPFSEEEYRKGMASLKNGKAAGIDIVMVDLQKEPVRWRSVL